MLKMGIPIKLNNFHMRKVRACISMLWLMLKRIELDFQTLMQREEFLKKNLWYHLFESSLNFAHNFHANKGGQRKRAKYEL